MKLKPCPFCGRIDGLIVWKTRQFLDDIIVENWRVTCSMGGDDTGCGGSSGARRTKREAIEAWNARYKSGEAALKEKSDD